MWVSGIQVSGAPMYIVSKEHVIVRGHNNKVIEAKHEDRNIPPPRRFSLE